MSTWKPIVKTKKALASEPFIFLYLAHEKEKPCSSRVLNLAWDEFECPDKIQGYCGFA